MVAVTSTGRLAAAALCAVVALAGCATVRPASTVPPTGWPEPTKSASPSAQPGPSAGATPTASQGSQSVTKLGVTVPIPDGYLDATALVTDPPTAGPARLVAYLRNPDQHAITVQLVTTDKQDLAAFLAWYVAAQNAGTEADVAQQRSVTVAGLPGAEITLKNKADGHLTTVFLTMRAPGSLVTVTGLSASEDRRQSIESVATGLKLSA